MDFWSAVQQARGKKCSSVVVKKAAKSSRFRVSPMLPATQRLKRIDFQNFSKAVHKTVYNSLGTLKYVSSEKLYFSIVISKKHQKSAVKRNILRRQIYSIIAAENSKKPLLIKGILYLSITAATFSFQDSTRYVQDLLLKTTK